ncbi:hypothetical protein [Garciella nitratireducens]|uniref:Uncharacterized protein n=1 Tax=Garciella nitratireducens DSM 15102 TaxID=1121911 RepID=A0A1T4K5T8_9FIRM|nr:hypothetical protein [Garciella nitratireducens]SJZ37675.1 hypothetical protein SAMN02745973_00356 [Garciella nitratireducens DSM 15102]
MKNNTEICLELLESTEQQRDIISQKEETIRKLVNENLEQENLIKELLNDMEMRHREISLRSLF